MPPALERLPQPKKRGPQLPPGWREAFLAAYSESGLRWLSAKKAGVDESTVRVYEAQDPAFAIQVEDARQEYADSQEANLDKLGKKGNVVGTIVLLKKHRPQDFVERRQELVLHAHATVSEGDAKALLAAMLEQATPATKAALLQPSQSPAVSLPEAVRVDSAAQDIDNVGSV